MAEGGVDPWLPSQKYSKAERQPNISALPLQQNFPQPVAPTSLDCGALVPEW